MWSVITLTTILAHAVSSRSRFTGTGVVRLASRLESWYQKPALGASGKLQLPAP